MRRSRPGAFRARGQAAGLFVVLALAAGGCGGSDGDPDGTATAGGSATATETPTTSTSTPSDSGASTAPTAPSVPPATGPVLEIDTVSLNLPAGWEIVSPGTFSEAGFEPDGTGAVAVVGGPTAGSATLDSEADGALDTATADGLQPERLDDRTVGGSEGWVVTGSSRKLALQYQFGTIVDGNAVVISVSWDRDPPPDAQAVIDSILATVSYPV